MVFKRSHDYSKCTAIHTFSDGTIVYEDRSKGFLTIHMDFKSHDSFTPTLAKEYLLYVEDLCDAYKALGDKEIILYCPKSWAFDKWFAVFACYLHGSVDIEGEEINVYKRVL